MRRTTIKVRDKFSLHEDYTLKVTILGSSGSKGGESLRMKLRVFVRLMSSYPQIMSARHLGLLSPYAIQSFISAFRNIHAYRFRLRCSMIGLTSFPAITPLCDLFSNAHP
mgnify:FL=1